MPIRRRVGTYINVTFSDDDKPSEAQGLYPTVSRSSLPFFYTEKLKVETGDIVLYELN